MGVLIFFLGASVGSFIGLCVHRIPRDESIVKIPSHCEMCNGKIAYRDLIPIVSFILLRGRCRKCSAKINKNYFLLEVITGIIFLLSYLKFSLGFTLIKSLIFISLLMIISIIDLKTQNIYFFVSVFSIVCGILFSLISLVFGHSIYDYIIGGLIGGGFIFIIVHTTHGMGEGDIEICAFCGLFLGVNGIIVSLFLSFLIGGIIGIVYIISKKKSINDYVPFGPFVGISSILTLFFINDIMNVYLNLIVKI